MPIYCDMANQLPELMTIAEVAKAFRVSEATIRRWAQIGQLATVGFGRTIRFRREDIEQALTPRRAVLDEEPHAEAVA